MNKILIDTMQIYDLLTEEAEDGPYFKIAKRFMNQKIAGVISVVTIAELTNHLGRDIYKEKLNELLSTNLEIIDVDRTIAMRAGELHMIYKLPLGDSLIAASGIIEESNIFLQKTNISTLLLIDQTHQFENGLKMAR